MTEPMTAITVRAASCEDIAAIAELERLCFSVPWSEKALSETLQSPHARLFCAEDACGIIAYGGMYLLGDTAEITNIATHPGHRRRGAASAVLCALMAAAADAGAERICLEVRASNTPAEALYASHGFVLDGVRKNYYKQPTEHAHLMSRALS